MSVLLLLALGCGPRLKPASGSRSAPVVSGDKDTDTLSVVAILQYGIYACSATLIAPRVIVTAAHCLRPSVPDDALTVAFGDDVDTSPAVVAVAGRLVHPGWTGSGGNDIAMLLLEFDAPVPPAPFNTAPLTLGRTFGKTVRLVGYGYDDGQAHTGAGIRRSGNAKVILIRRTVFNTLRWAGTACFGDSGGAAFLREDPSGPELLVGVTRYADPGCALGNAFTRVDAYADFIQGFIDAHPPPPVIPCGDIDHAGRCDGAVLSFCDRDELRTIDCAPLGRTCGPAPVGFDCVPMAAEGGASAEGCGTVDYAGECNGQTLRWCEGDQLRVVDCSELGKTCGYDASQSDYNCVAPPSDPCNGVGADGRCDGTVYSACREGALQTVDCAQSGQVCGASGCEAPAGCGADAFACNDGTCLPAGWRCDGFLDCMGGEDEAGCP